MTGSDERVPERVLVCAHAGKLPRTGVEPAVQPKMAVGLHARKGVPEMGRELPRNERVVGILRSFLGCLLMLAVLEETERKLDHVRKIRNEGYKQTVKYQN